jgi:hypothetical protein
MAGSWSPDELPDLTDLTCRVTSPRTSTYNCIAWAASANSRWWWPDDKGIAYWPIAERKLTVDCFVKAFETLGYKICLDDALEPGIEKIAIFIGKALDGSMIPTHAALQLPSGEWASKLGPLEDIVHPDVNAVNGPLYGRPYVYMCRPRANSAN